MANLLSTAITGTATTSGSVVIGGTFGNNPYNNVASTRLLFGGGNEPNNYFIGTNLENYGGNYTKLDLRWHTGIRMGARPEYGGIRFFNNETLGSRIMSIGETDANVRIDNNLYIGGAGGWITDLLNAKYSTSGGTLSGSLSFADVADNIRFQKGSNHLNLKDPWSNFHLYIPSGGIYSDATAYYFRNTSSTVWLSIESGNVQASSSLRAPIFYDSNDTNYYLDPNSTSSLNRIVTAGRLEVTYNTDRYQMNFYRASASNWWVTNDSDRLGLHLNNVGDKFYFATDGDFYSTANGWLSTALSNKQNASTAITTSNIGSQSVNYASSAGSAGVATYARRIDGPDRIVFDVGGDSSTFYPIAIYTGAGATTQQYSEFVIERGGYDDPGYTGIGFSTFNARFTYKPSGWGYGATYFNLEQLTQTATMLGDYQDYYQGSQAIIWLRGATRYWIYSIHGNITLLFGNESGTSYSVTYNTFDPFTSARTRATTTKYYEGSVRHTGAIYSGDSIQAPIFYDSDNTGYYVNPANTSNVNRIDVLNTYVGNAIYFGGGNNYFNWDGARINSNVGVQSGSDMRAPIFYDSNDTNYYVDPNSTSRLVQVNLGTTNTRLTSNSYTGYVEFRGSASNYLGIGCIDNNGWGYIESVNNSNGLYFYVPSGRYAFDNGDVTPYNDAENSLGNGSYRWSQVYTSGWLRQYGAQGMYNQDYGTHFYSSTGAAWNITGSGGNIELRFRSNHESTIRGYVYADTGNQIGFLNNGGGWNFRTTSDKNAFVHGQTLTINADNAGWSSIFMNDGDEGAREIHCNSNRIGFLTQAGSWGAYLDDSTNWYAAGSMQAPIFYDSADTAYYLDPNGDTSLKVYGEISNSNYQTGRLQPGALNIGRTDTNYAWDGTSWADDIRLGILANCSETWEMAIHDSGDSVMSVVHYDGGNTLSFGRNLSWGNCYVNAQAGYISNSNPWGTNNSAFFPNGITTAGGTNWIYGFTYIGNAPGNGNGHEFNANGTQYSTTSITTPTFIVNSHSDNTRGYRIHNTSGTAVSAMFVNSSNQLVFAAGAVDQINLNKKVYVNGVALGVNVSPSATAGRIDASNDIVAYSSSDERLKYNITPIENAIDKVKSLTGVEFDWKPEYKHAHGYEGHDTGIIAQQVQEVIPSAVRTNDTGFLAVRYEKLIGLLIEANKELAARVEELEKKLG